MAQYEKGEKVICTKFDVCDRVVFDKDGFRIEKYVDDKYFNREAVITDTWKDCALSMFGDSAKAEDREQYEIEFTDNKKKLAWVYGKDLVRKMSMDFDNDIKITAESIIAGMKPTED